MSKELLIYQATSGALELRSDDSGETVWATQKQIASIFGIDRTVVSRHIANIFKDDELDEKVVSADYAHTTQHGAIKGKTQTRELKYYNLDIILAVGYRTKSNRAIQFRKWATETLKQHIVQGYTINKKRIEKNKEQFVKAIEDLKILSKDTQLLEINDVLSLIQIFSDTWFSLDQFDSQNFPQEGTRKEIGLSAKELKQDIGQLKQKLIGKGEATQLFAQEKREGILEGIFGSVFQSVFGEDAYPSIEEKAAHLLYFIVKNHPFNDGNKRSGAFAFIWLLQKAGVDYTRQISPQTLTTLTILIAESNPIEKDKMVGLILLLLNTKR